MTEIIDSLQVHPNIEHINQFRIISQLFALFLAAKKEDQETKKALRYGTVNTAKKEDRILINKVRQSPPQSQLKRHVVNQALLEYKILHNIPDLLQELLEFHDIFESSPRLIARQPGLYSAKKIQEAGCSKRHISLINLEKLVNSYENEMEKEYIQKRRAEIQEMKKNSKNVG